MTFPVLVADFKAYFTREFVYGNRNDEVKDADISRALAEAAFIFNESMWSRDDEKAMAYLYLSAHFLILNIQASGGLGVMNLGQGLNSQGVGNIASTSVGSVSVNYTLPESLANNPILYDLMRTDFGKRYLQIIAPRLVANCFLVSGDSFNETTGAI